MKFRDPFKITRLTKKTVAYACPKCDKMLDSDREDIGKQDACPFCNSVFVVPGADLVQREKEKAAEKERKIKLAEQHKIEEAQREKARIQLEAKRQKEQQENQIANALAQGAAIKCPYCDGIMSNVILSSASEQAAGCASSNLYFIVGLLILIFTFWTIIGAIIGIAIMLASLFITGSKRNVWKCNKCGSVVNRG